MAISPQHSNSAAAASPGTGPVAVGRFIAPIAGKTLSRGGTQMAGLLSQWAAISGPSLAAYTVPEKMTKAAPEPGSEGKTPPSVLHLKVDPVKALEVQYAVPQLIERINRALGYKAVASIRLVQAPMRARAKARRQNRRATQTGAATEERSADKENRLGSGVGAHGRRCQSAQPRKLTAPPSQKNLKFQPRRSTTPPCGFIGGVRD